MVKRRLTKVTKDDRRQCAQLAVASVVSLRLTARLCVLDLVQFDLWASKPQKCAGHESSLIPKFANVAAGIFKLNKINKRSLRSDGTAWLFVCEANGTWHAGKHQMIVMLMSFQLKQTFKMKMMFIHTKRYWTKSYKITVRSCWNLLAETHTLKVCYARTSTWAEFTSRSTSVAALLEQWNFIHRWGLLNQCPIVTFCDLDWPSICISFAFLENWRPILKLSCQSSFGARWRPAHAMNGNTSPRYCPPQN